VADVAADSTEATKGVWSFEVRITPQENKLIVYQINLSFVQA